MNSPQEQIVSQSPLIAGSYEDQPQEADEIFDSYMKKV